MIEVHEIAEKEFVPSLRGYNREEVRAFLRAVARDYQRLLDRVTALRPDDALAPPAHEDGCHTTAPPHDVVSTQRLAAQELEQAAARLDELLALLRSDRSVQGPGFDPTGLALPRGAAPTDETIAVDHVEREGGAHRTWPRRRSSVPVLG